MLFKKQILPVHQYSNESDDLIKDVKDGSIYKDFRNTNTNKAYTFTLNTDGISLCDKSNLSIWPVFLAINELDIESRFYIDNIIIAGKIKYIFK